MLENINLKDFPKESGVYWFISNDEVVYVGSSCNLHQRMYDHRKYIKKGFRKGRKTELYQFLQSNQFTVDFQLNDNYRQLEQELIEKYNPKYNEKRAYTGCGTYKGRELEWQKDYEEQYKEERNLKDYNYNHQMCFYKDETLTLGALKKRFIRKGIEHPVIEAKKYLIR